MKSRKEQSGTGVRRIQGRRAGRRASAAREKYLPMVAKEMSTADRAAAVMFDDAADNIAAARDEYGQRLGGRDWIEIQVAVPDKCDGLGEQIESLYNRVVIARRGALERLVVGIDTLCGAEDASGSGEGATGGAEISAAAQAEGSEVDGQSVPVDPDGAADAGDIIFDEGKASIALHRAGVRRTHFGARDCIILSVSTYTGNGCPAETPDGVFQTVAFSARPDALEYVSRRVFSLAKELDPAAQPTSDYQTCPEAKVKAATKPK